MIDFLRTIAPVLEERLATSPVVAPELSRLGVAGLRVAPPSLEELFLRHYGDDLAALEGNGR